MPIIVGVAGADEPELVAGGERMGDDMTAVPSEPPAAREITPIPTPAPVAVGPPTVGVSPFDFGEPSGSELAVVSGDESSLERFLLEVGETSGDQFEEPRRPELGLENLSALDDRDLPAWFRTDLPRICRTCRDYRPSADGRRGWCANRWAFTHRRMVQEDEPAPCDSSIGDWWIAVDDVWLVAADVSAHGRATPLLDRLTGGKVGATRKRS